VTDLPHLFLHHLSSSRFSHANTAARILRRPAAFNELLPMDGGSDLEPEEQGAPVVRTQSAPLEIAIPLAKFRADYPNSSKVGFLMMRFTALEKPA
jgi:hypothetical protein